MKRTVVFTFAFTFQILLNKLFSALSPYVCACVCRHFFVLPFIFFRYFFAWLLLLLLAQPLKTEKEEQREREKKRAWVRASDSSCVCVLQIFVSLCEVRCVVYLCQCVRPYLRECERGSARIVDKTAQVPH